MEKYQNKTNKKIATLVDVDDKVKVGTLKYENGKVEIITLANLKKRWVLVEKKITKQKAIDAVNKAVDKVAKDMRVKPPKKAEKTKTSKKTINKNVKQTTQKGSKKVNRRKKKLEKITYEELVKTFEKFNKEHEYDENYHISGVIVVDQVCFSKKLSETERSYEVLSTSPLYMKKGEEVFGTGLDGKDNVELGQYLKDKDELVIEYCYLKD